MTKLYNIKVNGKEYAVEVEEVGSVGTPSVSSPVTAPAAAPAAPKASAPVSGNAVKAPMPGTILKINVKVGDSVKKGDVLCVLEAMKMENDIKAAEDGTVSAVHVSQGASVNTGDALISL